MVLAPAVDVLVLFRGLAVLTLEGGDVSSPSGDKDAVESLDDRLCGVFGCVAALTVLEALDLEEVVARVLRDGRDGGRGATLSSSSLTVASSCSSSSSINEPGMLCDNPAPLAAHVARVARGALVRDRVRVLRRGEGGSPSLSASPVWNAPGGARCLPSWTESRGERGDEVGLRASSTAPLPFDFLDRIASAVLPNTEYPISGMSSASVGRMVLSASLLKVMNSALSLLSSLSSPSLVGPSDPILMSSSGGGVTDVATAVFMDIDKAGAADGVSIDILGGGSGGL